MTKVIPIENTRVDSLPEQTCFETRELQSQLCRICLEGSKEDNVLLSLCKCSGSVKYVHEECTKTWILSREDDIDNAECELCLTKYKMDYTISTRCSFKKGCKDSIGQCIFAPLLASVLGLLLLIIYMLVANYSEASDSEKIYTTSLIIMCSLAFLIILVLVAQSIKESYCVSMITKWNILPQSFSIEEDSQSIEVVDVAESNNTVLILPTSVRVNGRQILTPTVAPSLTSVNRRGQVIAFVTHTSRPGSREALERTGLSATFPQL